MARKSKSPLSINQTDEVWYCSVRKLHTFVQGENEVYFRPSAMIVVAMKSGMLLAADIENGPVPSQEIHDKLVKIMIKPPIQSLTGAHRPAEIHFEDEALAKSLEPLLAEEQVVARYQPQRENMDSIIQQLEASAFGDEEDIPGLLKQRGVKQEQVGSLFAAALEFYRAKPWIYLANEDVLAVQVKGQKSPYYVVVMGQGGEEYGLSVCRNWKEVESLFHPANPADLIPRGGRHALLFNAPPYVSIDDLDAIETYGWELPAPDLIPTPWIYVEDGIKRPDAAMLRWYEAALRAIPRFTADDLKTNPDGSHPPVDADIEVETLAGKTQVHIRYPGGDLSSIQKSAGLDLDFLDEADEDIEDDLPMLDRRGMEGMMAQLAAGMEGGSQVDNPALKKAQQIMYDAWEERTPVRRIALAKKALKTSPDCADAYVLLAEEEAKTASQALEYYRQAVDAGRRALGEDFLNDPDNIGYFWGILETRPFMRALEGLASTQWKMGQREEAEKNFRELLRLNPGDNQGIRYMLLSLLVGMGKDDEARALLKKYKEDWSAEAAYTSALLAFREKGDKPASQKALAHAFEVNQHVPEYLTGKKRIPTQRSDTITMGGEDEAVYYASEYLNHWRKTPGAVEWLRENFEKQKK